MRRTVSYYQEYTSRALVANSEPRGPAGGLEEIENGVAALASLVADLDAGPFARRIRRRPVAVSLLGTVAHHAGAATLAALPLYSLMQRG